MKRKLFFTLTITAIIIGLITTSKSFAQSKPVNLYFFYGQGCPHCAKEEVFLEKFAAENPEKVKLYSFEIYYNRENAALLQKVSEILKTKTGTVPYLIIGDKVINGYLSDATTGQQIKNAVFNCFEDSWNDPIYDLIAQNQPMPKPTSVTPTPKPTKIPNATPTVCEPENPENLIINLPFLDQVDLAPLSLPLLTMVIAFLDGFNPCAMWVLLFLISLLLGMQDKKRMWIFGITFIVASAIVYFVFLAAWLNLFMFIGYIDIIKKIVGGVAIISGILNLKKYRDDQDECKVVQGEKRQKVFSKLKNITQNEKFWLALIGIILLAVSVNLIELVCSFGLPAIYTQALSLSNLSRVSYYLYLFLYILIFMLDDIAIFVIAMVTLQMTGISTKYTKYSSLIGGIIILVIGILLLFKPEWLMFG